MIRIKKQFFQSVWITLFCNERFYGTAEENQQTQASLVPAYQPFHFSTDLLTVRQCSCFIDFHCQPTVVHSLALWFRNPLVADSNPAEDGQG